MILTVIRRLVLWVPLASLVALPAQAPPSQGSRQPSAADLTYLRSLPIPATTIADVVVRLNGVLTDIGDIDVVAAPDATNGRTIMDATFRLTQPGLHRWMNFHWVQAITTDDCPANYTGAALRFPQVDPPLSGWDYMYFDGAARTMPNLGIPNFGWFIDDEAWYYNSTGEGAMTTPGTTYGMQDAPGHCAGGGATSFVTWLAAESPGKTMCLIRGFRWTISSNALLRVAPIDIGAPTLADAALVTTALTNSRFAAWRAGAGCDNQLGFDGFVSVDPAARTIGFTLQAVGPARGAAVLMWASNAFGPIPTPFGSLLVDPVSLQLLTTLTLSAAGFGELRVSVPAAAYAPFAIQVLVTNGATANLTNYGLFGTYANALATEIFAARYDGARDVFSVLGKGTPGDSMEVMLLHGAALPRSLGTFTVPPAPTMIAFTHTDPVFVIGDHFEVWNRTRRVRLIDMR